MRERPGIEEGRAASLGGRREEGNEVQALEEGGAGKKLLSCRSAAWERVPNVVVGTWGLGLRRAGNLVMKCSSAPLSDSVSFPAASSAMALPVLTQPVSAPCTKLSIASPVQTPKKKSNYLML